MPDLWYTAATANEAPSTPSNDDAPAPARPEPCTDDTTEPTSSSLEGNDSSQEKPTPGTTALETDNTDTCAEEEANAAQSAPSQDTEHNDGDDTSQDGTPSEEDSNNTSAPQENPEPPTAPAPPAPSAEGRLAPGALRQMVIDHLRAHPADAFTATQISRIIEKSSGAIANALDKLVSQGIATQVNDRPRRFQLANSTVNTTQ
ncbi:hypothetical protein HEK616_50300 [Streptomyces nigrescens]|uniref:MarR family transcriptional regulator n=1 Tax=Streptomyces nigrescens TaxID=1920 RepID=A0ABN6R4N5_STRNI|nr:hypothetical protein [Streptomyces nigrescens]BDM71543.1 hypothetical protein HEK616_50300 [Streptomyces nigrescens]